MQQSSRVFWPAWAKRLQDWKLDGFTAWLLEAGGPLTLLSAQALYFASPLVDIFFNGQQVDILAKMLEEDGETHAFIDFLRQQEASV